MSKLFFSMIQENILWDGWKEVIKRPLAKI
jgi:hypothetical protein